ncbi:acyl carrier protein [Nocardia terpenica]|uniref:Acyl carrier protein n=1 Tax=Nocardia terpenica TaxID=455432 RepID=A0A161XH39_9NOCA|nr:acyl carrier protein [Nocardia terpenica]KZM72838.1 acyl carrier protein [Nocardia terpenica]NQE92250.1 acyl carrier protein [Nocardia terpenica]
MAITQEEVVAGIAEIIEEVTGIDASEVAMERSFVDDLEVDSLSLVEIVVQVEDRYGVRVPDGDLEDLRTVGDAVAYVQRMEADRRS